MRKIFAFISMICCSAPAMAFQADNRGGATNNAYQFSLRARILPSGSSRTGYGLDLHMTSTVVPILVPIEEMF